MGNKKVEKGRVANDSSIGKKQQQQPNHINAKTMCKLDHLKDLASWTVSEPSAVPSLGAFFGQRVAATSEALGLRADPSLFVCGRCESILQVGHNCTVRIEKISKPRRRRKKSSVSTQNNVVYKCHFCSHRNLMRGTPKGYIKDICPRKAKIPLKSNPGKSVLEKKHTVIAIAEVTKVDNVTLPVTSGQNPETGFPESSLPQTDLSLLDSKRKRRNRSNAKKVAESESSSIAVDAEMNIHPSSKRRKQSWTSLKEMAQRSEQDAGKKLTNITIPFVI